MQRPDDAGINPHPFEGGAQRPELNLAIGGCIQVLQHTAAADREMRTWRVGAAGAGGKPLDYAAFMSPATSRAEPGQDEVARRCKWQENRLTLVAGYAVAVCADPFDR